MKKLLVLAGIVALAGCATEPRKPKVWGNVIPKADNTYTVETRGESNQTATARALESATATCSNRGMRHIVTAQKAEYKGQYGTEAARDIIDAQAKAIADMKRQSWTYPSYDRRNDYQAVIDFRCEA